MPAVTSVSEKLVPSTLSFISLSSLKILYEEALPVEFQVKTTLALLPSQPETTERPEGAEGAEGESFDEEDVEGLGEGEGDGLGVGVGVGSDEGLGEGLTEGLGFGEGGFKSEVGGGCIC